MGIEFNASPHASLGVEVEINLVDQASRALANRAAECLIAVQDNGVAHPKLKPELFDCTVEAITGVCETVGEARADLEGSFATLRSAAKDRDLGLLSAGTHPFSDWQDLVVSPNERYRSRERPVFRQVRSISNQWPVATVASGERPHPRGEIPQRVRRRPSRGPHSSIPTEGCRGRHLKVSDRAPNPLPFL